MSAGVQDDESFNKRSATTALFKRHSSVDDIFKSYRWGTAAGEAQDDDGDCWTRNHHSINNNPLPLRINDVSSPSVSCLDTDQCDKITDNPAAVNYPKSNCHHLYVNLKYLLKVSNEISEPPPKTIDGPLRLNIKLTQGHNLAIKDRCGTVNNILKII